MPKRYFIDLINFCIHLKIFKKYHLHEYSLFLKEKDNCKIWN